ncbi:collagen-like protein [Pectobacterium brasiliense]|uniref:collagen-like protein n=1 Tax=Pectobacterium brasiliense TaxID=180957 RepID=UPI001968FD0A|nr:collagen-like protein [Pectobacterium brasiliense]MBN3132208.1 collagen-like protein [Pectobacterium brasiliense]
MKTNTTKTLIALVVTAAVAPMSAAHASNVDVNNFLVKAHGKNFQEAVNAYDNLNQRDRMVVDGIADKTDLGGKFLDIKGVADRLAHTHTATPGWDSSKTQAFIDVANGKNGIDGAAGKDGINGVDGKDGVTTIITKVETDTATQNQVKANTKAIAGTEIELLGESNLRRVSDVNLQHQINAANAKLQGDELTQMNRDRTANQHVQPVVGHNGADGVNGKDGAAGKDGINGVDGKDGVTTVITKVETDTATQNQVKANTAAMAKQDRTNDVQTGQIEVTNLRINEDRASIAATNARLTGDELTQMNIVRTANQHVQPVVGHDGADGINGKDGKDGVTTVITKVETDTATQNQVKANTAAMAKQDRTNDVQTGQIEVTNLRINEDRTSIAATNARLTGDELTQMNRDRTANQHVQPVVGHDGADGVNGKDGANGKNGIDGAAGKDGINGVDGKDGVTTIITKVETDTATQNQVNVNTDDLKGLQLQQANHDRTASQHVQPVVGHDGADGINGKDGANGKNGIDGTAGKDGVTTVITKVETDTATTQQVSNNAASLRAVRSEQAVQGAFVQHQATVINQHSTRIDQDSAAIAHNSQRIDQNAKRIDETKEDLKRGLNNAAAMSSLHFNGNRDSWALSTGSANGEGAALAGGMQKSLTEHTAVTVQYSDSLSGGYMVGAGIHGDW